MRSLFFIILSILLTHSLYKQSLHSSSLSSETGDINLRAKNDLSLISADISSGRNLNLGAGNSINILAAKEYKQELSAHKRTRFNPISVLNYPVAIAASVGAMDNIALEAGIEKIGGGSFTEVYRSDYSGKQIKEGISKLSDIKAAGDISLNSPTAFITSNMKAGGDINVDAKNLTISAATNEYSEQSSQKSTSVSITKAKDSLNQMKPKSLDEFKKDTSLKAKIASASYDKSNMNLYGTKAVSSNIEAKNITLRGDNSLSVIGSNLKAKEDLNLISKDGNINIINSTDTASSSSSSKHLEASLSLTVQNEYAQLAPAAIALAEAVKQLNKTKKQYKEYKQQKNALQDKLVELKNRYKAKEVGIDYSDIEDLQNIIEDVKDEEKYYLSNIALATANVASKTAALISQGSAASSSWVTWGFSVGASAELSGTTSKDSSKSTSSVASNLSSKNIKILTDSNKDTAINIKGSNLYASNDIYLNTHNLFIDASQDSYEAKQSSKTVSGRVSATMYGGGGGSAGLDYSKSNMKEESLSHNNAKVYAGHNIYALASNDALIKGANLRADNALALKVGHDLSLASLRDSYNYDSKSSSIGAGIGISGSKTTSDPSRPYAISNNIVRYSNSKLSSINANYSRSKSSTMVKQTVLSSITAKQLDIEVGANTDLKGSLIAAGYYDENGNFIDNGKLRLKTNTLTFSNLSNTRYDKSNSLSIGTNYAFKDPQQEGGNKHSDSQASDSKSAEAKESARLKQDDLSAEHIQNTIKSIKEKVAKEDSKNFSSSSVSLSRLHSVRLNKTLATVGRGNLIINNEAGSDELSRLNRDTAKIQKDIVNSNLYSSAKADIDHRFFSQDGRDQIKKELLLLTDSLSNHMPSKNSKNAFERTIAKGLNSLGTYSLGLIPSEENNGGLLANIGAIAVGDPKFKILGNPKSKRVFVNGILTDEDNAKDQARYMTGRDYRVLYNPSRGFLSDILETGIDLLPFTTGIAKQVGHEIKNDDVAIGHSQGSAILNSGLKNFDKHPKKTIYAGTPFNIQFGENTYNYEYDPVSHPSAIIMPTFWSNVINGVEMKVQQNQTYIEHNPFYINHVYPYNDIINRFNKENK